MFEESAPTTEPETFPTGRVEPPPDMGEVRRLITRIARADRNAAELNAKLIEEGFRLSRHYRKSGTDLDADLKAAGVKKCQAGARALERKIVRLMHGQAIVEDRDRIRSIASRHAQALSWTLRKFPDRESHEGIADEITQIGGYVKAARLAIKHEQRDRNGEPNPDVYADEATRQTARLEQVEAILSDGVRVPLPDEVRELTGQPGRFLAVIEIGNDVVLRHVLNRLSEDETNRIIGRAFR